MSEFKILIPARRNSKGLPFKNRKLLSHTLDKIPEHLLEDTFISTDDEIIKEMVSEKCHIHHRSKDNSRDTTSTLSLVKEFCKDLRMDDQECIVMLYLTYPERLFSEVLDAFKVFKEKKARSLLCKKEIKTNPYLCMYDLGNNLGKQIIEHNLYRRQDYPKIFEISHYISIFSVGEVQKLNNNMYNKSTFFYSIDEKVDVDEPKDLERFLENDKN